MPTAPGSHLLGVDWGMEPQEQGGVALSSASAMPKPHLASSGKETEGRGRGQHARAQESSQFWGLGGP
jgi:hypothetical protein